MPTTKYINPDSNILQKSDKNEKIQTFEKKNYLERSLNII